MYDEAALQLLKLTQEDFVLIALLVGGDYLVSIKVAHLPHVPNISMKERIKGCGINIATELAYAGFGGRLMQGIQGKTVEQATFFLTDWRADLIAELGTNTSGFLQQRQSKLALTIMPDFPDPRIINLYIQPRTSEGNGSPSRPQPTVAKGLDVAALAMFASRHFNWVVGAKLVKRFASTIFPGLAMHELVHIACLLDQQALHHPVVRPLIGNVIAYWSHPSAGGIKEACIDLHLPATDLAKLYKIAGNVARGGKSPHFHVWTLVPVLQHVLPDAIELGPELLDGGEGPSGDQCMCHSHHHPSLLCSHRDTSS